MKDKYKLLFIFFYVAAPAFLAWIGYAVYNFDHYNTLERAQSAMRSLTASHATAYYDLPQVTPSVSTGPDRTGTVKVDLSIEVSQDDLTRLPDFQPRILDRVVLYLRSKGYDDMHGVQYQNLRQGLEREVRRGAFPIPVIDVVIKEMAFE